MDSQQELINNPYFINIEKEKSQKSNNLSMISYIKDIHSLMNKSSQDSDTIKFDNPFHLKTNIKNSKYNSKNNSKNNSKFNSKNNSKNTNNSESSFLVFTDNNTNIISSNDDLKSIGNLNKNICSQNFLNKVKNLNSNCCSQNYLNVVTNINSNVEKKNLSWDNSNVFNLSLKKLDKSGFDKSLSLQKKKLSDFEKDNEKSLNFFLESDFNSVDFENENSIVYNVFQDDNKILDIFISGKKSINSNKSIFSKENNNFKIMDNLKNFQKREIKDVISSYLKKYKNTFKVDKIKIHELSLSLFFIKKNYILMCSIFLDNIQKKKIRIFNRQNFLNQNKSLVQSSIISIQKNLNSKLVKLNKMKNNVKFEKLNNLISLRIRSIKKVLYSIKYGCFENLFIIKNKGEDEKISLFR